MCLRFKNFVYKPESIEIPDKVQVFSVLPEQPMMAQVVPMSITELDIDPLCCTIKNCPEWIKCKHSLNEKWNQSGNHRISIILKFVCGKIIYSNSTVRKNETLLII